MNANYIRDKTSIDVCHILDRCPEDVKNCKECKEKAKQSDNDKDDE